MRGARTSDGDFSSDRHSCQRGCRVARQPQPSSARCVRRRRVRDTEPRSVRRTVGAVHEPLHRLAAVHAGAPRHPLRRARLPLEAVGIDRALGGHRSRTTLHRAGVTTMLVTRPSAPVRDRRRELPRRLHGVGLRARATRATRGRRAPTRAWMRCARRSAVVRGVGRRTYDRLARRGSAPRTTSPDRGRCGGRGAWLDDERAARTTASCCSSTSSIRTSRSTRPSRGRRCTTPTGTATAPRSGRRTSSAAIADGRARPSAQGRQIRANYGAKLSMIDHWFGGSSTRSTRSDLWDDTAVIVCTDHGHYLGEATGHRLARPTSGASRACRVRAARPHPAAGRAGRASRRATCDALTTNVDLHATIADVFGVERAHRTHGRSLVPLLTG